MSIKHSASTSFAEQWPERAAAQAEAAVERAAKRPKPDLEAARAQREVYRRRQACTVEIIKLQKAVDQMARHQPEEVYAWLRKSFESAPFAAPPGLSE